MSKNTLRNRQQQHLFFLPHTLLSLGVILAHIAPFLGTKVQSRNAKHIIASYTSPTSRKKLNPAFLTSR